jgi:hypothetical protein
MRELIELWCDQRQGAEQTETLSITLPPTRPFTSTMFRRAGTAAASRQQSSRPSMSVPTLAAGPQVEAPLQLAHKRILGWKLTSMARRKYMIKLLDRPRVASPQPQSRVNKNRNRAVSLLIRPDEGTGSKGSLQESPSSLDDLASLMARIRLAKEWSKTLTEDKSQGTISPGSYSR